MFPVREEPLLLNSENETLSDYNAPVIFPEEEQDNVI